MSLYAAIAAQPVAATAPAAATQQPAAARRASRPKAPPAVGSQ